MALKMNKQIALIAFTILFFFGMVSAAWADIEYLVPTSFVTGGNWTGTAADIDAAPTIDTNDFVSSTTRNGSSGTSNFADPSLVQSGDTINSVTAYIDSQCVGGANDNIRLNIT